MTPATGVVLALAGRRIDAPGGPARFPPSAEQAVAARIRDLFERTAPSILVSSAACGSDIIGLEAAATCGIRRRIILPFDRARFRETSVTDRPGDWGTRYDAILAGIPERDIIELGADQDDDPYARTNDTILDQATSLAGEAGVVAVVAWNGQRRGARDLTAHFRAAAAARGIDIEEIDTLNPGAIV